MKFRELIESKRIIESDVSSNIKEQLEHMIDGLMEYTDEGKQIVSKLQDGVYDLIYYMKSEDELEDYVEDTIRNHGMDMGFEDEDDMEENLESWEMISDNISAVWAYISFKEGNGGKIVKVLEQAIKNLP